jgi:hypothetical protein
LSVTGLYVKPASVKSDKLPPFDSVKATKHVVSPEPVDTVTVEARVAVSALPVSGPINDPAVKALELAL